MSAKAQAVAAAIIGAAHATFPALVLLGAVHVSADAQAAIMVAVTSYVTLGGLVFALFHKSASAPAAAPVAAAPGPAPKPVAAPVEVAPVAAVAPALPPRGQ